MEGHPVQSRWPHEERPEGLCTRRFCGVVLFTSRAKPCDYQISPICRRKCGKSSVTVRNLPNDFGKKEGWSSKGGWVFKRRLGPQARGRRVDSGRFGFG